MDYKYNLSVCLCIKNEAKYMEEFVNHYINQGVDHFYIINNNSTDNIEEVVAQTVHKDKITLINDNRNMNILTSNSSAAGHKQLLDENLYDLIKRETKWAIIIDADEFMYGKNGDTIKSYLSTIDEDIGCIYVIWNIINPNKINDELQRDFSIKTNVKRLNYDLFYTLSGNIKNANDFGKSIVRTSMLMDNSKIWLHKIQVSGLTITNYGENKTMYDNCNQILYSEENFNKLNVSLNHYAIRNFEDYEKKQKQINVVSEKNRFIFGLFEMLDLNDDYIVVDDSVSACKSN